MNTLTGFNSDRSPKTNLKIYFAGKVELENGYRDLMFKTFEAFGSKGGVSIMHPDRHRSLCKIEGGSLIYGGPTCLFSNYQHESWDYLGGVVHGSVIKDSLLDPDENEGTICLKPKDAVARCLIQIQTCDAVHAYIDSTDCHGTIAELGYASGINKPIYLVFDPKFEPKEYTDEVDVCMDHNGGLSLGDISGCTSSYLVRDCYFNGHSFESFVKKFPRHKSSKLLIASKNSYVQELLELLADGDFASKLNPPISYVSSEEDCGEGFSVSFNYCLDFNGYIRDDLWFIKNLPGVKSILYGDKTTIDKSLIYFQEPQEPIVSVPQPETKPELQSVADRLKSIGVINGDASAKKLGGLVSAEYKRRNPNQNPQKVNGENSGIKVAVNVYPPDDWKWIDELLKENCQQDITNKLYTAAIKLLRSIDVLIENDDRNFMEHSDNSKKFIYSYMELKAVCLDMGFDLSHNIEEQ